MIILGIDPGSRKAGFGLVELKGRDINYLDSFTLKFDTKLMFFDRLKKIYESCCEVFKEYSPDEVAFESLVYVKNVSSLVKLSQARGVMLSALFSHGESNIFEYSPNFIKASLTSYGLSSKESVEKSLKLIFGDIKFETDDSSDALAIAFCHSVSRNRVDQRRHTTANSFGRGKTLKSFASSYLENK